MDRVTLVAVRHGETGYNAFEFTGGAWRLHTWNDTSHLNGCK